MFVDGPIEMIGPDLNGTHDIGVVVSERSSGRSSTSSVVALIAAVCGSLGAKNAPSPSHEKITGVCVPVIAGKNRCANSSVPWTPFTSISRMRYGKPVAAACAMDGHDEVAQSGSSSAMRHTRVPVLHVPPKVKNGS